MLSGSSESKGIVVEVSQAGKDVVRRGEISTSSALPQLTCRGQRKE